MVAAVLGAGLLTACGQTSPTTTPPPAEAAPAASSAPAQQEHRLEVEVTGTATLTSLAFTLDAEVSEETAVTLPWRKSVVVPYGAGRHEWTLTLQHTGGDMAATATVNGKLVTRTGGGGSAGSNNTAKLSGSFTD
ncbi:hypothetical protein CFN78_00280 [Amycolatopsis antarctica]|uniref:Uncharacterized protein n=1 Tax=Amycolatopsis antarctica TaxID=1854586 RepID=A0A263D8A6_9PSEU|nr:hypothetical protein CFN78_00280 [Amycolatopsis antarctica]